MDGKAKIVVACIVGMSIALLSGTAVAAETPGGRTVHQSTDFGWEANQDVTEAFTKLLEDGTLKAGDELVLKHTYRINLGNRKRARVLPANFTLSAVKGAGFNVYGLTQENKAPLPVLELGDRNTLRNLSIVCEGVPTKVLAPSRGAKYFRELTIFAKEKDDILIENCLLSGLVGHNIRLDRCRRPKIIGCRIVGGYWSVVLGASDALIWRCVFEQSTCDSIKTGAAPDGTACKNIVVENCVFQDNGIGDGIDTTGGFDHSVVRNSIFRRLGVSGLDIKSFYQPRSGRIEDVEPENHDILIESCLFLDTPNAIVLTTLDGGRRKGPEHALLNADNMKQYAVHDIDINDCVVGHAEKPLKSVREGGYGVNHPTDEREHMRAILLKDAYNIRYRNLRLSGERIMPVYVHSIGGSRQLTKEAAEAIDCKATGNILDEPSPPIEPGVTEAPFACGPR